MCYDFIYNSSKINSLRIACDTERLKYVRLPISRSNVFKGLEGAQCRIGVVFAVILVSVAIVGIGGTFSIGQQIKANAIESWERQAEQDVATASVAAESWVAQGEALLKGIAVAFRNPQPITEDDFQLLVLD